LIEKETLNKVEVIKILGKLNTFKSEGFRPVENIVGKLKKTKKSAKTNTQEPVLNSSETGLKKEDNEI
jgi:hypothetical protein